MDPILKKTIETLAALEREIRTLEVNEEIPLSLLKYAGDDWLQKANDVLKGIGPELSPIPQSADTPEKYQECLMLRRMIIEDVREKLPLQPLLKERAVLQNQLEASDKSIDFLRRMIRDLDDVVLAGLELLSSGDETLSRLEKAAKETNDLQGLQEEIEKTRGKFHATWEKVETLHRDLRKKYA